jgi:hypothetical protein
MHNLHKQQKQLRERSSKHHMHNLHKQQKQLRERSSKHQRK